MTLQEVITNHIRTTGKSGLQSVETKFHLVEPTFAVDGVYAATRRLGGQMRVDIFADGVRVFSEGYDGRSAWQLPQDASVGVPVSDAGRRALLHGIDNNLYGLDELIARGHRLTLDGQTQIDGKDYAVIMVQFADGHTQWRYINTANWQIERSRERKALHPDIDPTVTTIETQFGDFRPITNKTHHPFHEQQIDLTTGKIVQTTTVTQMVAEPPFAPDHFACPT